MARRWLAKAGLAVVLSGASLAGVALLGAAPASASTVTTPSSRITGSTHYLKYGQSVTLTGTVTHASGSRINTLTTQLQWWTAAGWRTIQTKRLDANGYVKYSVKPDISRKFRLYFPGWSPNGVRRYNSSVSGYWGVTLTTSAPSSSIGQRIVAEAASSRYQGAPYVFGAAGPNAYDCSGYTLTVFRKFGLNLPHLADAQMDYGRYISPSQKQPGDLIFYLDGGYAYHVAIYAGGGWQYDTANPQEDLGKHRVWGLPYTVRRLIG